MVVLRREIARQTADLFGEAHQHVGEVILRSAGDRRDFDRRAVWQFGVARENHHAVLDCAFVAHGRKIAVRRGVRQHRFQWPATKKHKAHKL